MPSYDEKNRYPFIPVSCSADLDFDADPPSTYEYEGKIFTNALIRGINAIYYYAPRIKPGDEADFAGYTLGVFAGISGCVDYGLETIFFPVLGKKYDMSPYSAQQAAYRPQMKALTEYMTSAANKGPYDGQKVRALLEGFGDDLVKAFNDLMEVASTQRLKEYDPRDIEGMLNNHRAFLEKMSTESPALIFNVTHHDLKTAPSWPPQAKKVGPLDQLDVYKANPSVWKFAPYNTKGEPQTYA